MTFLVLINTIFSTIATISNLVSRLLFNVIAYLLVIAIHALRVPGQALQSAMEHIAGFLYGCVEYLLEMSVGVVSEVFGFVFDVLKDGVFWIVAAIGAVMGAGVDGVGERMRAAFDWLVEDFPAVLVGAVAMVTTMVTDLWNNYIVAQSYVRENA